MGEWHVLKYVIFAKSLNIVYCVNLLSGAFLSFTEEEYDLLFHKEKWDSNFNKIKKFVECGILVNFNEYEIIQTLIKLDNTYGEKLILSICPTMDCNFNCPYCFEEHRKGKMSLEIQDKIIELVNKISKNEKINKLQITWFGGEPLLYPDIIESLSDRLIKIAEKNKLKYFSNIITNGYLLNQKNADILTKAKVDNYQITLDGVGSIHNKTRCLKNGEPTFDKIIDNIKNTKITGIIKIRQNIYKDNLNNIQELKDFLDNIKKTSVNNITYYFSDICNNDNIENNKNIKLVSNLDFNKSKVFLENIFIPKKKKYSCGAQKMNFITIDELGNLYKCRDKIKLNDSFGNIIKWDPNNPLFTAKRPDMITNYINTIGAINDEECKNCVWFPVCVGGCPMYRIYYQKKCIPYKGYEKEFVLKIAEQYNKNEQEKSRTD